MEQVADNGEEYNTAFYRGQAISLKAIERQSCPDSGARQKGGEDCPDYSRTVPVVLDGSCTLFVR